MIQIVINICFLMLAVAVLFGFYRFVKGPTVIDRMLSFDVISICSIGYLTLLSIQWKTYMFLELILIFSLIGFISTVVLAIYLYRTHQQDLLQQQMEKENS